MSRGFCVLVALALSCTELAIRQRKIPQVTRGDLGRTFKTVDEAAVAACNYVWQHEPRATRYEYCGAIYRDDEGIKAGLPVTDDDPTHCRRPLDPPGTTPEAGYHNHLQGSEFSSYDRKNATELTRYLCTPSGIVKKMTPEGWVIVK